MICKWEQKLRKIKIPKVYNLKVKKQDCEAYHPPPQKKVPIELNIPC